MQNHMKNIILAVLLFPIKELNKTDAEQKLCYYFEMLHILFRVLKSILHIMIILSAKLKRQKHGILEPPCTHTHKKHIIIFLWLSAQ